MKILLDNGHGNDTPGKRSPDGLFREFAYNRYIASPILQQEATPEDLENHIDIADWLIRLKTHPVDASGKRHSVAFLKAMQYIVPEYHDNVEAFIEEFELCYIKGAEVSEH